MTRLPHRMLRGLLRTCAALTSALALAVAGCGAPSPSSSSPSSAPAGSSSSSSSLPGAGALREGSHEPVLPPDAAPVDVVTVVPVFPGEGGHPDLLPPPPALPVVEAPSRSRRRMDLDQLNEAYLAATGGITWTESGVNQWVALGATLGRPDFLTTTDEDLSPAPLFQKFLGDAARKVCSDLFVRELAAAPGARVFFVDVGPDETSTRAGDRLDANLARLLLRFHGRDTRAPGTEGALDGWRWLFQSAERLEGPRAAWNAVCVALLQHPDFYTY